MPRPRPSALNLTITSLTETGYGLAQKAGQTITVARTVPGDQVLTGVPHRPDRWTSADLVKVTKPGPDRVASGCEAFDQGCGGCQWLHLNDRAQLAWKEKHLSAYLRTRAGFRGRIDPIAAHPSGGTRPSGYRNKLSLKNLEGRLVFVPETGERPLAPATCLVQTPALQDAWAALKKLRVPAGIEQVHLRSNPDGQVGLHAFVKDSPGVADAVEALRMACGARGAGATGRSGYRVISGESHLVQTLGGRTWLVPHNGFFQTNEVQAEVLLDVVRQQAGTLGRARVLDLYCGVGFFGLGLSGAHEVVGIEENPQSVAAAQASAQASGVTNARFLVGDLGPVLAGLEKSPVEIAVVDPPREGLLPRAVQALVARSPRRLVYVSCYPASLVRDLKLLLAAGWRGVSATAVDMFPHTSHLEVVVTLER